MGNFRFFNKPISPTLVSANSLIEFSNTLWSSAQLFPVSGVVLSNSTISVGSFNISSTDLSLYAYPSVSPAIEGQNTSLEIRHESRERTVLSNTVSQSISYPVMPFLGTVSAVGDAISSQYPYTAGSWNYAVKIKNSQVPLAPHHDYGDVGEALSDLSSLDIDDEARIEGGVFDAALFVATMLMAGAADVPKIFSHGPKSVVFNWDDDGENKYLTVSDQKVYLMKSTVESIDFKSHILLKDLYASLRNGFSLSAFVSKRPAVTKILEYTSSPLDADR